MGEAPSSSSSVASLARERGFNANQMFFWRKLHHAGQLESSAHFVSSSDVRLLPGSLAGEGSQEPHDDAVPAG